MLVTTPNLPARSGTRVRTRRAGRRRRSCLERAQLVLATTVTLGLAVALVRSGPRRATRHRDG